MQKNKKGKIFIIACLIYSLISLYGFVPNVNAAISDAKDTISDSDLGATATHVITFTTGAAIHGADGDYMQAVFAPGFTGIAQVNVTCPANTTASSSNSLVECVVDGGQTIVAGAQTITVISVTNPNSSDAYNLDIATKTGAHAVIEATDIKVYIINDVTVTAHVPSNLTFAITGLAASQTINGTTTTVLATNETIPFGNLQVGVPAIGGQELTVSTNAADGFTVTVQQTDELTNAAGSNINSFNNSQNETGSTTPGAWAAPRAVLGQDNTYGHLGLTTSDDSLSLAGGAADRFASSKFAGLNGTAPLEVMYNNGASNGTVEGNGLARVAYAVQISALQEAGDYSTVLTYICTPQY